MPITDIYAQDKEALNGYAEQNKNTKANVWFSDN